MKPLIGKTCACEMATPAGQMKVKLTRTYEPINGGKLRLYGDAIFPDRKIRFKMHWEMTPDGNVADNYFSLADGGWKAGHSRVWSGK